MTILKFRSMKPFFTALVVFVSVSLWAQQVEFIVDFAEEEPHFPGGESAMIKFINENIDYPLEARANGEQGIVYIQFVVRKTGELTDVKIMKGVSVLLDAEAEKVVKAMPKWMPGVQKGKKVSCRYTLPISFVLGPDDQKNARRELRKTKKKERNPNVIDY